MKKRSVLTALDKTFEMIVFVYPFGYTETLKAGCSFGLSAGISEAQLLIY